jgi:hypothetical protein
MLLHYLGLIPVYSEFSRRIGADPRVPFAVRIPYHERETMKIRFIAAAFAATLVGGTAHAGDIYLQGGTQGIGLGYAQPLAPWVGVRADVNGFGLSHQFNSGGATYDAHLHLFSGGTYVDLFPFASSSFRVSAGAMFDDDYLHGNAVSSNGSVVVNGTTFFSPNATASATVKYPSVMPYLGIGFGHKPVTTRGFGFMADLGVAYGRPHVSYTVSPALLALAGANNVNAEEQDISNTANRYRFYPIVQVGVSYRF